ncbi:MAG: 6-phosphofructokinase [Spirochaetales bacterium]|nr:6-phosphofructokinase [Spirochaetales bacterium]
MEENIGSQTKVVGILTSGGDCPGLNAAIRAVGKSLSEHDVELVGILDGFTGLIEHRVVHLGFQELSGLLTLGGTILGTSRNKPHKMPQQDGSYIDMTDQAVENYHRLGLDCLVCLGGGGTQKNAFRLMSQGGINVVTLPKTIDNDIWGTDLSFGYDTAMTIACEAIDRLHSTASSHHRIMLIDVMGHNTGWLALGAGLAGGADVILIPEIPYKLDSIYSTLRKRKEQGKRFSIVVVAEGAISQKEAEHAQNIRDGLQTPCFNFFPHQIPRSEFLANLIEEEIGLETRVTTLGHLQRGGIPSPTDRVLATRLGVAAAEHIIKNDYGKMMALKGPDIIGIPLSEVAGEKKFVTPDHSLVNTARSLSISLGE